MVSETSPEFLMKPIGIDGGARWRASIHPDERGSFSEIIRDTDSALGEKFVQTNVSESKRGVLRGLHFQKEAPQGKLITVLSGGIIDFGVDLRQQSPTKENFVAIPMYFADCLYIPPGCAHGFYAINNSTVMYQCTTPWDEKTDSGIFWRSSPWGVQIAEIIQNLGGMENPILSGKDQKLPKYDDEQVYFK